MSGLGPQLPLHFRQDIRKILDGDVALKFIEDLDETAHVGAFEVMGEVDIHIDAGDRMLNTLGLIENSDGVPDVFHADFVDLNSSMVPLTLNIVHLIFPNRWHWLYPTPRRSPF